SPCAGRSSTAWVSRRASPSPTARRPGSRERWRREADERAPGPARDNDLMSDHVEDAVEKAASDAASAGPGRSRPSARQINDTIRYTMWSVFTADPAAGPLPADRAGLAVEVEHKL